MGNILSKLLPLAALVLPYGNAQNCSADFEVTIGRDDGVSKLQATTPVANTLIDISAEDFMNCRVIYGSLHFKSDTSPTTTNTADYHTIGALLENIEEVTGDVRIYHFSNLISISNWFSKLTAIGNWLFISSTELSSMEGAFPLVENIGSVLISANSKLSSMEGAFPRVKTINNGDLEISANISLSSMAGFTCLTTIDRSLKIENNSKLSSIEGSFNSLTRVGQFGIEIGHNDLKVFSNCFTSINDNTPIHFKQWRNEIWVVSKSFDEGRTKINLLLQAGMFYVLLL